MPAGFPGFLIPAVFRIWNSGKISLASAAAVWHGAPELFPFRIPDSGGWPAPPPAFPADCIRPDSFPSSVPLFIRPNFMLLRFLLLAGMATGLTSCGTVAHLLGTATAPLTNVLSSVTSGLRLSDSPEESGSKSGKPKAAKVETPATSDTPASDDRQ
jgi:hypothetical protein